MNEMNSNRVNKIQPGNEHLDKVVTPTSNTTWSPANNLLVRYFLNFFILTCSQVLYALTSTTSSVLQYWMYCIVPLCEDWLIKIQEIAKTCIKWSLSEIRGSTVLCTVYIFKIFFYLFWFLKSLKSFPTKDSSHSRCPLL